MKEMHKLYSQAVSWTTDEKLDICNRILPVFNELQLPLKEAVREAHTNPPAGALPVTAQEFWDGLFVDYGTHWDNKKKCQVQNDPLKELKFQNQYERDENGAPKDLYTGLDIQDWLKYLYFGCGRLMKPKNPNSYAEDQELFFKYFGIPFQYKPVKGRDHCLFAGDFSLALNECLNIRNNYTHREMTKIDALSTYQILPVMQQILAPLCDKVWPGQADCQEKRERLPKKFYQALGEVAFPVEHLMEAAKISDDSREKVEQMLLGAGIAVEDGNAWIFGDPVEFADLLRLGWWLACRRSWIDGVEWLKENRTVPAGDREEKAEPEPMELSDVDLLLRADSGDTAAQVELGHRCRTMRKDENGKPQHAQAADWYEKASSGGNYIGQYWLGKCYLHGRGRDWDQSKGISLIRSAAEQGVRVAQVELGEMYLFGWYQKLLEQDPAEAVSWFRKAAEQLSPAGLYRLGQCYEHGFGMEKPDLREALNCYQQAAHRNSMAAQVAVAKFYEKGLGGLAANRKKAVEMYRELAEAGSAFAQAALGLYYETVEQNMEEAVRLYQLSADKCAEGAYRLAECYRTGKGGVDVSREMANTYYRKAANWGHVQAMVAVADGFYSVIGGREWYIRAAMLGDVSAMVNAGKAIAWNLTKRADLSLRMSREERVEIIEKSHAWYRRAANAGSIEALKEWEYFGRYRADEAVEIVECYTKIANGGNKRAMVRLAEIYDPNSGWENMRDRSKAQEWYQRAERS